MSINRLKLNKDKTELLYLFSKYNPQQCLPPLRFGTDIIKPSSHARNIGAIFDNSMPMLPHVNNVCKSAFYHFRTISCIKETSEIHIHAFVTSKLSILYYIMSLKTSIGAQVQLPDWLHALGSVISSLPSSLIFPGYLFLNELKSRVYYLPSRLCIQDVITRYLPSRSLRSSSTLSLNPVSFNLKTYGSRAFAVSALQLWSLGRFISFYMWYI